MISGLGLLADQNKRLREALEQRAFHPGHGDFARIEYCDFCSWSRSWIAKYGHADKCLLKANANNGEASGG